MSLIMHGHGYSRGVTISLCALVAGAVILISGADASSSKASSTHNEVSSLPGWEGPLPSRWFSGFGDAGPPPGSQQQQMFMHYIFIESERDPASDPVLVWYNGGPGASSLFGLMVELGPLLLNADSLQSSPASSRAADGAPEVPRLIYNPFGWTKVANLLVVNSPPPVGFSYCEPSGPKGDGNSCGAWNDELVATANHAFLTNLFNGALRAYLGRDLFLSGESYAGIYVPMIAREVMKDPRGIRLAGFAVGDGCLGTDVLCGPFNQPYYQVEFFHGHGQVSERLMREIRSSCPEEELRSPNQNPECRSVLSKMGEAVGGYYAYGLYDECYWNPGNPFLELPNRRQWGPAAAVGGVDPQNGYPCPGEAFSMWLSHPAVREALHVHADSNFFNADNAVGFDYSLTERDVRRIHLQATKDPSVRVLVYNGDTDPVINSFATQDKFALYWEEQGVKLSEEWRPWTLDGKARVAGYVMEYEGNWSYATVRGSGHMVPEYKPATALEMISAFLEGRPLKRFVKPQSRQGRAAGALIGRPGAAAAGDDDSRSLRGGGSSNVE